MAPEDLLAINAKQAIFDMAESYLLQSHPKLDIKWYSISKPKLIEGTLTEVTFTMDKLKTPTTYWDDLYKFSIRYHRLDVGRLFSEEDIIYARLPVRSHMVLREALAMCSIPMDDGDVGDNTVVSAGVIEIAVEKDSYRFVGKARLTLSTSNRPLVELVQVNYLVTDFSKDYSSANVRFDLIRHLNNSNFSKLLPKLSLEHISICCPLLEKVPLDRVNTRVKLIATGGGYRGDCYVYYKRRHFLQTFITPLEVKFNGNLKAKDYLREISALLGCVITYSDVKDTAVERPIDGDVTYATVFFKETSMGYVGELRVMFYD